MGTLPSLGVLRYRLAVFTQTENALLLSYTFLAIRLIRPRPICLSWHLPASPSRQVGFTPEQYPGIGDPYPYPSDCDLPCLMATYSEGLLVGYRWCGRVHLLCVHACFVGYRW